jgi:hypothetical protein
MRSRYIPANLASAQAAHKYATEMIESLQNELTKRKRVSLRAKLQIERLKAWDSSTTFTENEMADFGRLLDQKLFSKEALEISKNFKNLSKEQLIKNLASTTLELKIERGYGGVIHRTLEQLQYIADGDEYRKTKTNAKRQSAREKNFKKDNKRMSEVLAELRQELSMRPLIWDDYKTFLVRLRDKYEKPLYEQEVRVTAKHKNLKGEQLATLKRGLRAEKALNPWGNARTQEFFTEATSLKPPRKPKAS